MSTIPAGYKQTEVGVIPEEWEASSLGEIVKFSGGSQPPRSTFIFQPKDGYVRLIQIRDYKSDEFATYVPIHLARKFCTAQEIMIGRYGPPIFQILRGIEGAYNVALLKASPLKHIDSDYLFAFLKQDSLLHFVEGLSQRSSGQTGIEMPALKTYPVPLPPLPEQKRIAQVLGDVDALIQKLEVLIAKKRDIKQAAMQELITGRRRLPGFQPSGKYKKTEVGVIPEEWDVIPLQRLVEKVDYGSAAKSSPYGRVPVLRMGNLDDGKVTWNDLVYTDSASEIEKYKLQIGDVLFNRTNTIDLVGKTSIFHSQRESIFAGYLIRIRTKKDYLSSEYLNYFMNTSIVKKRNKLVLSVAVGQANINGQKLRAYPVPLPPFPEQTAIAQVLSDMDSELTQLESRLGKTRDLKAGLIQNLLTGKIRLI